ncbi:MAG: tRNA (guanosine(37)-N1)-methyltransferase TrmD [Chloroflexota bacterium]|nr:tRNA (guanosine(37)-N1)-methyltransferase TrmD [Chloroflexota bacterium]MDE2969309.1 tRNA (guanosine(37)-N1)-methyltransferase TrmD [Chloroflexota bacterium]
MDISILTLFPGMFAGPLDQSILGRVQERGLVRVSLHNIRDYAEDRHHVVDDAPFGGGPGMVMKPEPLFRAVEAVRAELAERAGADVAGSAPVILLSPQGRPFTQAVARELAAHEALVFICGRYEGIDARAEEALATDAISIGDYVLTGGEIPAMAIVDAVVRLLPGALGDDASAQDDSFSDGLLEGPSYTRPAEYRGMAAPEVLLSGDHGAVARWRRRQALLRTWQRRLDLLASAELSEEDRAYLRELEQGGATE